MKIEDPVLVKNICEAAILAADHPLSRRDIVALFDELEFPGDEMIDNALKAIEEECETRGFYLKKVSSGYRFQVKQDLSTWVSRLWQEKTPRYSRALLETLALVAYRQPITRGEIEEVRGVAVSSHIIKTLQEREWVKVVGHREVPGRPAMYATTKEFLDYFNLQSISELPPLAELRDLSEIGKELGFDFDAIEAEAKAAAEAAGETVNASGEENASPVAESAEQSDGEQTVVEDIGDAEAAKEASVEQASDDADQAEALVEDLSDIEDADVQHSEATQSI
ncbi:SMC-Scp complex subunit ScpB, partial [bacterium]|nr:SMC-Scp complex subunit ScpB [bacterium]